MHLFQTDQLLTDMTRAQKAWHEFLRTDSLSMGLYTLKVGQNDLQSPHTEDEVYYVLAGRARFRAGHREMDVQPGTILFVERHLDHRFFEITQDLTLLVFFAPPEYSLKPPPTP